MQFSLNEKQQQVVDSIVNKYKDKNEFNTQVHGESKKAFTNGLSSGDIKILEKFFAEHLVDEKILVAMVLVEFMPWNIHTDYSKGDLNPGKAILIPWQTQQSNTLVFNETCTDTFVDYPVVSNHITQYDYEKYLSHCDWDDAQRVSLKEIFAWERGKAVTWDRRLLHTSDNFIKNGVDKKIALVIFTERV